ncbi:histidine kinase [Frigoribacterium sp. UYMn621]|jgi:two-component system sensor histidine kinase DesK|uniref:sensor histidine kinase n=1 Tax=Frigoribacterium sp. UYMn621 TaxID=3156343 RepID=UPI0033993874
MPVRERLRAHGARSWYIGAGSGLIWQVILVFDVLILDGPVVSKVLGLLLLAVLYAAFMLLGPILWVESVRTRLIAVAAYWAASFLLFPLIGPVAIWMWLLVVSLVAFINLPLRLAIGFSVLVILVQGAIGASVGFTLGLAFAPMVTAVGAATFIGLGLISRTNVTLRGANEEIARLAVVEERARFSRDLHDVLGHSLTVVTMKSELARRLVTIDPEKAELEIADIERLTRSALADLRLAVSNYRETTVDAELVAAKTALAAAGIQSHLPESVPAIDPRQQGVFAWVLREGVTNVIRHSGATACWVTIDHRSLTVADDGRGPGAMLTDAPVTGNGLRGLRERSAAAAAELLVGQSRQGGFELVVRGAA